MGMFDWFFNIFRAYPVRVNIAEVRGDAIRWDWDRASIVSDKGIEAFALKNRAPDRLPVSKFSQLNVDKKGRSVLNVLNPAYGQYEPMTVNIDKRMMETSAVDSDMAFWSVLEARRIDETYKKQQSFLEKYGYLIGIVATVGVLAFTVIYVTQSLETISGTASGAGSALSSAVDKMTEVLRTSCSAPKPAAPAIG